jgi:hypothetical protein
MTDEPQSTSPHLMKPAKVFILAVSVGMLCGYLVPLALKATNLNRSLTAILAIGNAIALCLINLFMAHTTKARLNSLIFLVGISIIAALLWPNARGIAAIGIMFILPSFLTGAIVGWERQHPKGMNLGIRGGLIGGLISFFAFIPARKFQLSVAPTSFDLLFLICITLTSLITQFSVGIAMSCIPAPIANDVKSQESSDVS